MTTTKKKRSDVIENERTARSTHQTLTTVVGEDSAAVFGCDAPSWCSVFSQTAAFTRRYLTALFVPRPSLLHHLLHDVMKRAKSDISSREDAPWKR